MSLILPPRPNLDHLKKQAKDRLVDLQAASPGAQLADAQHALARDYGFASWPKLKAHVEALAASALEPPAPRRLPLRPRADRSTATPIARGRPCSSRAGRRRNWEARPSKPSICCWG